MSPCDLKIFCICSILLINCHVRYVKSNQEALLISQDFVLVLHLTLYRIRIISEMSPSLFLFLSKFHSLKCFVISPKYTPFLNYLSSILYEFGNRGGFKVWWPGLQFIFFFLAKQLFIRLKKEKNYAQFFFLHISLTKKIFQSNPDSITIWNHLSILINLDKGDKFFYSVANVDIKFARISSTLHKEHPT